jgi:hypothetical protein
MTVTLSTSGQGAAPIKDAFGTLSATEVLVGIPEANSPRKGGRITNAQLLFIHSNGSPIKGIPKRMVIEPAVENPPTAERINTKLQGAATAALDGDNAKMLTEMDLAGTIGESASKAWFTDPANGWPPNKPATIRHKLRKLETRRRVNAILAIGTDLEEEINTTLIDTSQMRRAITHVVETGQ